ncbi:MAG: FAD-dependent monooxygenase [Methyloceanibacter sp.]|uniref:FAD-dependent monooxygenase n=1 Tax=Methyloceanibacter sp. TaxID=1965321 RepID=UPI003D6CA1D5
MAKPQRRVLIAGGGIGGLSASIALARYGIETTVLERSSFAEETGAGIQLGPNATRLLRALGVLDAIEQAAFEPEAVWVFDGLSGRRLAIVPLGPEAEEHYGAPYLTLHRADLHAALLAVARQLALVEIRPNFEIARFEADEETVAVGTAGGSSIEGSSLVGADGLWSAARKWIAPDARLRFTGGTACRALLSVNGLQGVFGEPIVGLWLGPGSHLVHYPVRGGKALNVVAVIDSGSETQGWNQAADPDALRAGFTHWCKDSKSLLEQAEGWRLWSLYRLRPLGHWSRGPTTLLGDAAHPVLPFLAQGAALAIEDAVALAASLAANRDNAAEAFLGYETLRRRRTTRVQRVSRRFGWLYHLRGPARLARNFALARRDATTALDRLDWLYGERTLS